MFSICDEITRRIKQCLESTSHLKCGDVMYDLNDFGSLMSSKKRLIVTEPNGQKYLVTVEDIKKDKS